MGRDEALTLLVVVVSVGSVVAVLFAAHEPHRSFWTRVRTFDWLLLAGCFGALVFWSAAVYAVTRVLR